MQGPSCGGREQGGLGDGVPVPENWARWREHPKLSAMKKAPEGASTQDKLQASGSVTVATAIAATAAATIATAIA